MGINVPIIAGIKPVSALNDINLLPQTFHIDLPHDLVLALQKCKTDKEAQGSRNRMGNNAIERADKGRSSGNSLLYPGAIG